MTDQARCLKVRYYKGVANHAGQDSGIAIPVLTPDRAEKRQNGRRFKENGEPMFTLTGQDRHGVAIEPTEISEKTDNGIFVKISENLIVYAVWYEKMPLLHSNSEIDTKRVFQIAGMDG